VTLTPRPLPVQRSKIEYSYTSTLRAFVACERVKTTYLETTSLRSRPKNRWQDEVREDGRLGGKWWKGI